MDAISRAVATDRDRTFMAISGKGDQTLFDPTICQIIEQGHAICLGPQADHAGVRKGGVFHLEQLLSVIAHLEPTSCEVAAQQVPLPGRYRRADAIAASATHDLK